VKIGAEGETRIIR